MLKSYDEEIVNLNKELERIVHVKASAQVELKKLLKSYIYKLSGNFKNS